MATRPTRPVGLATSSQGLIAYFALGLLIVVWVVSFRETLWSMVLTWWQSATYNHGFLVLPLCAWLIWRQQETLSKTKHTPKPAGLVALGLLGVVWLVGNIANVQVVKQLGVVAMLPMFIVTIMGSGFSRRIAFPLAFLVFAVPFGDALIPSLMDFTAVFTVAALRLVGVPVLKEGMYLSIPSGNFEVAEACSGIRYLMASVMIGSLYAHLRFRSFRYRALFVIMSLIVPIIANGIRAFGIVMIAHWSDLRWAVGVDHLIYGWIFFGVVILCMLWVGGRIKEPQIEAARGDDSRNELSVHASTRSVLWVGLAAVVITLSIPMSDTVLSRQNQTARVIRIAPQLSNGWIPANGVNHSWRPELNGAHQHIRHYYQRGDDMVALYFAYFSTQEQGSELVSSDNLLYDESLWYRVQNGQDFFESGGESIDVRSVVLQHRTGNRLIWYFYWVDDREVISPFSAKGLEVVSTLLGRKSGSGIMAFAMDFKGDPAGASETIGQFLDSNYQSLRSCLLDEYADQNSCGD